MRTLSVLACHKYELPRVGCICIMHVWPRRFCIVIVIANTTSPALPHKYYVCTVYNPVTSGLSYCKHQLPRLFCICRTHVKTAFVLQDLREQTSVVIILYSVCVKREGQREVNIVISRGVSMIDYHPLTLDLSHLQRNGPLNQLSLSQDHYDCQRQDSISGGSRLRSLGEQRW